MWIIKHKTLFFIISLLLVAASIVGIVVKGLNLGIDFTGGSLLELSYEEASAMDELHAAFDTLEYTGQIQPFGDTGVVVRTRDLSEEERQELVSTLAIEGNPSTVEHFTNIGPSVGKELSRKAIVSLVVVMLAIILFVAWAFRSSGDDTNVGQKKVSIGPSSWSYGIVAVIALIHDIIIPTGIFVWLGLEINSLFVVGLLSILGLSVNDTIVVFDRIRESVRDAEANRDKHANFDDMVGQSIFQTMSRSLFTSLTIFIVLLALYFVGPAATQSLALVMIFGIVIGTYSSVFLASPLLVLWEKAKKKA